MKKAASLFLALVFLFRAAVSLGESAASEAEGFNPEDARLDLPAELGSLINIDTPESFAVSTKDQVSVSGNKINIYDGTLRYSITLPDGYIGFTQDVIASIMSYQMLGGSMEQMAQALVDAGIHLLAYDTYYGGEFQVYNLGSDAMSQYVVNLADLSRSDTETLANNIANMNGMTFTKIYRTADNTYMQFDNMYLTIVNSQLVRIVYVTDSGEFTSDDQTDAEALLSALVITY